MPSAERAKATDSCMIQKFEGLPPKHVPVVTTRPSTAKKPALEPTKAVFEPTLKFNR